RRELVQALARRASRPLAGFAVRVAGGDVARHDDVVVHAEEAEAQLFGALGDGNVTLAIAERTTRRGRYAEVHGSASHFCRNSAEDRAGGLTCVQTDRAT